MYGAGNIAVVIDAVSSGATPGTIHVWRDERQIAHPVPSTGSHALGVADAIALGRALDRLPQTLVVVGVEVGDTSPGHGLSPAVTAAVADVVAVIAEIVAVIAEIVQAGSRATSSTGE